MPSRNHPGSCPGKVRHGFVFENEVAALQLRSARTGGGPRVYDIAPRWVATVEFWPPSCDNQCKDRDLSGFPVKNQFEALCQQCLKHARHLASANGMFSFCRYIISLGKQRVLQGD